MAVTDDAIDKLKAMIVTGELSPGQRLPREADLAKVLGLSRSSLREAVRALSLVHILDVRQGDGTYVSNLSTESLVDSLNFIVDFHHDSSVLQLLEVRRILEPAASAKVAQIHTAEQLAEFEAIFARATIESTVDDLVEADVDFHRAIAAAAANSVLASLIDGVSSRTHRARLWRGITEAGALRRTLAEHRAILDAIAARDPALASATAAVHVAGVESWLRRSLAELD